MSGPHGLEAGSRAQGLARTGVFLLSASDSHVTVILCALKVSINQSTSAEIAEAGPNTQDAVY